MGLPRSFPPETARSEIRVRLGINQERNRLSGLKYLQNIYKIEFLGEVKNVRPSVPKRIMVLKRIIRYLWEGRQWILASKVRIGVLG
jgi:hypothetical protein